MPVVAELGSLTQARERCTEKKKHAIKGKKERNEENKMHRINHILAAVMVFAICAIVINSSTAHAEQITDKLSLSGWMDFNWARTDIEGGAAGTNDEEVFDITEVEFDIEFTEL